MQPTSQTPLFLISSWIKLQHIPLSLPLLSISWIYPILSFSIAFVIGVIMNEIASSQTLSLLSRVVSAAEILRITTSWPRNACSAHSAQLTEHTTQLREHTAQLTVQKCITQLARAEHFLLYSITCTRSVQSIELHVNDKLQCQIL